MRKLTHPDHLLEWRTRILEKKRGSGQIVVLPSGSCARAKGSADVFEAFEKELEKRGLDEKVAVEETGCLGLCETEPTVVIFPRGILYKKVGPKDVPAIVEKSILGGKIVSSLTFRDGASGRCYSRLAEIPFYRRQHRLLSDNHVRLNPERIEDYVALDGYAALARALFDMTAEGVIAETSASSLRERDGGFPAGKKWAITREAQGHPKYVVGFADRRGPSSSPSLSLLESDPHGVLEGMIIGAYAVGASEGYISVDTANPLALRRVALALDAARGHGLLGQNILGSEFHFDLHLAQGAHVRGDETSLLASIEGRRPYPRPVPPLPCLEGLWGKPTNGHDVETWANIPWIINRGSEAFVQTGTRKSKGTKLLSLSGSIRFAGFVEAAMGAGLGEIIGDIGGGLKDRRTFKAVRLGSGCGTFLPGSKLRLALDFETLSEFGGLPSELVVEDEGTCIVDTTRLLLDSASRESCGKCSPCRIGTRQASDVLNRIVTGDGVPQDLQTLGDLAEIMRTASLCAFGRSAANPVASGLRYFRKEYEAHIKNKSCPAGVCRLSSKPRPLTRPRGRKKAAA